jgi:tetratricopeptide (TPR) repeat protein
MKTLLLGTCLAVSFASTSGWAAGGGGPMLDTAKPQQLQQADPVIEQAQAAIAKSDWKQAQDITREAVTKNPGNADYHNLYAYSIRKGENPSMDEVFRHYNEALRIDPDHRNAHEYLGEAYLMAGNLDQAKEHLRILDKLCFFPCEQYTMLKKAIADYETKQARK